MDTTARVLVANRPRLLRELVLSTLSEQDGIRVVGEAKNEQEVPARRKLQYDLYYVCKASPLLDLRTLLRTARVVLFRQGSR